MGSLTVQQSYEEHGFFQQIPVLDPNEVDHYRRAFNQLEATFGKHTSQIDLKSKHFEEQFIWELATNSKILDAVEQVYGSDIVLIGTQFFCKYPQPEVGEGFVAWHQDVTYWGFQPKKAITAWLAIDDADVGNGCMRVVRGSHKSGIIEHGKSQREGNMLSVNQEIPDELVNDDAAVDLCLPAGTMSLHDGQLIHGSNPNRSDRRRCGLVIRYTTPEVRLVHDDNFRGEWHPVLLRGQDHYGHLSYVHRPVFARA